jgi:hypothetical protein
VLSRNATVQLWKHKIISANYGALNHSSEKINKNKKAIQNSNKRRPALMHLFILQRERDRGRLLVLKKKREMREFTI